jgi:aarF domain-containing kinase
VVPRATLPDGTTVAVKVLRPGIEARMAVDLAVMRPLFAFIGREVAIGIAGELPSLISGLEEQLCEEVDLRNEARSVRWFEHLRVKMGLDRVRVPLPIEGYVTKRVLVMDFLDGVPVDHAEAIDALGVDPAPLVQECVKAWFATALCTGAFHGDVHAGNLLITPDGFLGVLDWGIVGRLDDETQHFFRRVVEGAMGDESAWGEVWEHAKAIYGPVIQDQSGMTDEQMAVLVRMQIEPIFSKPFGEIDLTGLLMTPEAGGPATTAATAPDRDPATPMSTFEFWRSERRRRRALMASGVNETAFDRGMFLLGKQLVYFDRYGKLFLPDVPLLWDRDAFERLLAEPVVPAETPFA